MGMVIIELVTFRDTGIVGDEGIIEAVDPVSGSHDYNVLVLDEPVYFSQ